METIYNLLKRAEELRRKRETGSITAEDVGGLQYDTLAYVANVEQLQKTLGVRRVYKTIDEMLQNTEPLAENGVPLKFGQLVMVFDEENLDCEENGSIYVYQAPGWKLAARDRWVNAIEGVKAELLARLQGRSESTIGVEDIIALVLGDGQAHELGVRQVVKSSGRVAFADLTLGINFYFDYGVADSSPTGIREYWCKVARDGKYYIYYARINWDIIGEVAFSTDTPAETFTVSPYPVAHSVAGSNLLNMLQRLDYDIAEVTKYNGDGIAEVQSVTWRDGTTGTATYSDYRADVLEYATLTVTYNSYVKVVQAREYNDTGDLTKKTTTIKNA